MRAFFSALWHGPFVRRLFKRFEGSVRVDGALLEQKAFVGLLVGTVREVGLGFKLVHRADDDPERFGVLAMHVGAAVAGPRRVGGPTGTRDRRRSGPSARWPRSMDVHSTNGSMAYTIDGDLYRTQEPVAIIPRAAHRVPEAALCVDCAPARRYHGRPAMSSSFPLDGMRVRFAGDSNVGMKRAHNEDSFYLPESERLAIVADGMGGHASGEVASRMAVETIVGFFKATQDDQQLTWPFKMDHGHRYDVNRMVTAIKLANLKIHEQAQKDPRCHGMGTTVVSTLFLDRALIVGHVGDSRLYRRRDGVIKQLTEDHSLLNDYIKMKNLSPDEIAAFPHKNVIVRALGMKDTVQVDVHVDKPALGDLYVICSDGLTGMVKDEEIEAIATSDDDLDVICEKLITTANKNGGLDNITVVAVRVERAVARSLDGDGSGRRDDRAGDHRPSRRPRARPPRAETRAPAATRAPAPTTASGPTLASASTTAPASMRQGAMMRARPSIAADGSTPTSGPGGSRSSAGSRSRATLPAR